jgi:hypothetical protein
VNTAPHTTPTPPPAETLLPSRSTALQAGLAHLYTTRQPDDAIADHGGEQILTQGDRRYWFVPRGHRGLVHNGGPIVVVNVANPVYEGIHGVDRRLTNPLAPGELDGLADAIRSLGYEVTGTWNGLYETGSVGLAKPAHPSLLDALSRYHAGCPRHDGNHFCQNEDTARRNGHAPCTWFKTGHALIVGISACIPEGFLCAYQTGNSPHDRCDEVAADGSDYCAPHREHVARLDALVDAALAESAGADEPEVVAYQGPGSGQLFCVQCRDGVGIYMSRTAAELPEGGVCFECGTDVLIPAGGDHA